MTRPALTPCPTGGLESLELMERAAQAPLDRDLVPGQCR